MPDVVALLRMDSFVSIWPRFQRFRGLKSFRSSPWDRMENLPVDYSRIFQFQSFDRTRRRVLAEAAQEVEGAMVRCAHTCEGEENNKITVIMK